MNRKLQIAILADGDYPRTEYPLRLLREADLVICCDASVLKLQGRKADYIVGDMDTLSPQDQERYRDIIHRSPCQNTNDQTKGFSFALGLIPDGQPADIHILGATGKREDHTLGNLSLLLEYVRNFGRPQDPFGNVAHEGTNVDIVSDYGIFTPHFNTFTADCRPGQQISIFPLDPTLRLKSSGLKYPLEGVVFDLWWKATLNEAQGRSFTLEFSHSAPLLLYRLF